MTTKLFYLLLFVSNLSFSQFYFPTKKETTTVLNTKLAVELLEEFDDINKQLNEDIKLEFIENWKHSTVEFFTPSQLQEKLESKDDNYCYLTHRKTVDQSERIRTRNTKPLGTPNNTEIRTRYIAFTFAYYPYGLRRFVNGELELITSIGFTESSLSKLDYVFLVQQLNRLIEFPAKGKNSNEYYGSIQENSDKVKSSTLLILKDFFKEKDLKKMDSHYKYSFELVDFKRHEEAIVNREKGKTYLKILRSNLLDVYIWSVIDCETGRVLSQMSFGGIKIGRDQKKMLDFLDTLASGKLFPAFVLVLLIIFIINRIRSRRL